MPGILLDTHALYWLASGETELSEEALVAIGRNQESGTLFVSPITAWELSIASQKPRAPGRPHLGARRLRASCRSISASRSSPPES